MRENCGSRWEKFNQNGKKMPEIRAIFKRSFPGKNKKVPQFPNSIHPSPLMLLCSVQLHMDWRGNAVSPYELVRYN